MIEEFGVGQLLLIPWRRDPQLATHEVVAASASGRVALLQLYAEGASLYLASSSLDLIAEAALNSFNPVSVSIDVGRYVYVSFDNVVYMFNYDLREVGRVSYPGTVLRVRPINDVVYVSYVDGTGSVLETDTPELRKLSAHSFTYKILDIDRHGDGFIAIERLNQLLFLDNEFNITSDVNVIHLVDENHSMITPLRMDIIATLTRELEVNTVHIRSLGSEFVVGSTRGYLLMRGSELVKVLETYRPSGSDAFKIMDVNREYALLTYNSDEWSAVVRVDLNSFINLDGIITALMDIGVVEKEFANVEEI